MNNHISIIKNLKVQRDHFTLDIPELKIPEEGIIFIQGPSGSGKTTFLRALIGLESMDAESPQMINRGKSKSGDVDGRRSININRGTNSKEQNLNSFRLGNGSKNRKVFSWEFKAQDLSKMAIPDKRLGVVFQSIDLFPHLSVEENILFHARARRILDKDSKPRLRSMAQRLGFEKLLNQKASTLSGGEAQRVAIVRALIGAPKILILDEPFSALDKETKEVTKRLIFEYVKDNKILCFLVSHEDLESHYYEHHLFLHSGELQIRI